MAKYFMQGTPHGAYERMMREVPRPSKYPELPKPRSGREVIRITVGNVFCVPAGGEVNGKHKI